MKRTQKRKSPEDFKLQGFLMVGVECLKTLWLLPELASPWDLEQQ